MDNGSSETDLCPSTILESAPLFTIGVIEVVDVADEVDIAIDVVGVVVVDVTVSTFS